MNQLHYPQLLHDLIFIIAGKVLRSRHQSQSKWWWSCSTDLRYQTGNLKGPGSLLPEM